MIARVFILSVLLFPGYLIGGESISFEKEILPILQERCIECHQAPYEKNGRLYKPKAGLRMDGLAHLMFGSDDGPVLVPNHPSKSHLYTRVVLPADDDDRMPPKGDPLTPLQRDLIRQWIGQGADFGSWVGATDGVEKLVRKDATEQAKVPEFVTFFQKLGQ
ncbi:MAG: c-type cytochrome domain-containing protein, partial [Opitutae bacterium]